MAVSPAKASATPIVDKEHSKATTGEVLKLEVKVSKVMASGTTMGSHQQGRFAALWCLEVFVGWWVENAVAGRIVGSFPLNELGFLAEVTFINLHVH